MEIKSLIEQIILELNLEKEIKINKLDGIPYFYFKLMCDKPSYYKNIDSHDYYSIFLTLKDLKYNNQLTILELIIHHKSPKIFVKRNCITYGSIVQIDEVIDLRHKDSIEKLKNKIYSKYKFLKFRVKLAEETYQK